MNGPTFATTATPPQSPPAPPPRPAARPGGRMEPDAANGMRVLTYLRLHWLMILFCGTLLGGAGAYAAWELLPSKYESYALLQVSSVPSTLANQGNREQARTDFVTYLKTTAALIKSEFVLNAALRDIKDVPTIKDQREPIKFLDEEVTATWQDGSEVIRIVFKGHNPGDVKRVVDSVQKAFMSEVVMKEVRENQEKLAKIDNARIEILKQLENKAPKKAELAKGGQPGAGGVTPAGGIPSPGTPQPGGAPNPLPPLVPGAPLPPAAPAVPVGPSVTELLDKLDPKHLLTKLEAMQSQLEQLPVQINDARRHLKMLEDELTRLQKDPVEPAVLNAVEGDPAVVAAKLTAQRSKSAYQAMAGLGNPNSSGALEYKRVWEADEAALAKVRKDKTDALDGGKRVAKATSISEKMNETIRNLNKLLETEKVLKEALVLGEKRLKDLPIPTGDVRTIGAFGKDDPLYRPELTDLMSTDKIYSLLVSNFHLTKLELESPARVRILQTASTPTQKDMRKQILATVFALFMGYALIGLGVVAYETFTKRVSSLADLKTAGSTPVVGVIPGLPGDATGRDPVKRAAANEAIDKIRAYVAQTWLARGATSVAVTSPLGDEGKAFTAFGLASSLAQAGYKTLVVDFDLRTPVLHEYGGVPNTLGVCELLRGEAEPRNAIQFLPNGLHLLPSGKWSDEARKAAVGGRLEALLAKLKEPYDCVVLHGHALLTTAETVEIARRCEVVLVCARYRETTVPLLKKAAERVAAMEIPYSGVVYVGATGDEALC